MKNSRIGFCFCFCFCFCFWALLQISTSNAFSTTNPIYNVNLAPFMQRLSAYYCLKNETFACQGNFKLQGDGWLNISASETEAFCEGCKQHTQDVLLCVWYVKKDYKFENKATINNLNETINLGCAQGFNGTSLHSVSGVTRATTSSIITLFGLAILALFYM